MLCLSTQDASRAEALLRSFEERGGRCDIAMLNAWIGCYRASGDWRGAERVWQRISERKLRPDSVSYRTLIKVYTGRGSTAQLAKIGPLLTEMHEAGLQFTVADFQQLIKTAHACHKPNVVRSWVDLARTAGLTAQLDEKTRRIAANPVNRPPAPVAAAAPRVASPPRADVTPADLDALKADLAACLEPGDSARANQLLREFEQRGGQCTPMLFNMVLATHKHSADWAGAEAVWARMIELRLPPSNVSCRTLLEVYTRAGNTQRGKIKAVLAAMKHDGVRFTQDDYEQLIKTAHGCDLPREVMRWAKRARAADVFSQLDHASRRIAENAATALRASNASAVAAAQPSTAAAPTIPTGIPAVNSQLAAPRSEPLLSPAPRAPRPAVNRAALMALLHGDAFAASPSANVDPPAAAEASAAPVTPLAEVSAVAASSAAAPFTLSPSAAAAVAVSAAPPAAVAALPSGLAAYFADSDRSTIIALDLAIYRKSILEHMQSGSAEETAQIDALILEMQAAHLAFALKDYGILIKNAHLRKLPAEVRRWSERARQAGLFEQLDNLCKRVAARAVAELDAPVAVAAPVAAATAPASPSPVAAAPRSTRAPKASMDSTGIRGQLQTCVENGSSSHAEQIVREVHQRGSACTLGMIHAWIGSCLMHGDWESAERAWAFMLDLKLAPDNTSYSKLIQVYLHARTNAQLAKTGSLLIEMHRAGVVFLARDYERLIKCAHACKLPVQVRRWTEVARSTGVFDQLDELSRRLVTWPCNRDANAPSPVRTPVATAPSALVLHSQLMSQLMSCVPQGNSARAEGLLREFEQGGGQCDLSHLNLWMACCRRDGDWQGAERVWKRMKGLGLQADRASFSLLIQIYLRDGAQAQQAKIAPLLASMQHAHIVFSTKDYERLIHAAHGSSLTAEVRRFSERARVAGVFDKMQQSTRTIAAAVALQSEISAQPIDKAAAVLSLLHGSGSEVQLPTAVAPAAAEPAQTRAVSSAEPTKHTVAAAREVTEPSVAVADVAAASVVADEQPAFVLSKADSAPAVAVVAARESVKPAERPAGAVVSDSPVRTVSALSAWLKCYANAGDWKGAENAWHQASEANLKLTSSVPYRNLILVYLQAGGDQLAKIDGLLAEMHGARLSFSAKDFEKLMLSSQRCQRTQELQRWIGAARAAGVFEKIPVHIRVNAEKALASAPLPTRSSLAASPRTIQSRSRTRETGVSVEKKMEQSSRTREDSATARAATQLKASQAAVTLAQTNNSVQQQPQQKTATVSTAHSTAAASVPRPQQAPRAPRASDFDSPAQMELELARAIVRSLAALEQHPFRMDHAQSSTAMMQ